MEPAAAFLRRGARFFAFAIPKGYLALFDAAVEVSGMADHGHELPWDMVRLTPAVHLD